MSNKTQLQTNNTNLASYIDRVTALIDMANGLPEADGSGGSVETCNVEITLNVAGCNVYAYSIGSWKHSYNGTEMGTGESGLLYSLSMPMSGFKFNFSIHKNGTFVIGGVNKNWTAISGDNINVNYSVLGSSTRPTSPVGTDIAIIQVLGDTVITVS